MEKDQIVMGVCIRCGTTTTDIEGGGLFPGMLVCPDCKVKDDKKTEKGICDMVRRG